MMFKKAAYTTAIAALIGAGAFNAFPASAQVPNSDSTTTTQSQDGPGRSHVADMPGARYATMMADSQMGSYMADMTDADHIAMMDAENGSMMSGDLNHDSIGGMMGDATTPGNRPMNGR